MSVLPEMSGGDMKRCLRLIITVVTTVAVMLTGVGIATASAQDPSLREPAEIEQNSGVVDPASTKIPVTKYDDYALLQLLFAGVGPIADENPEILNQLGFNPKRPEVDIEQLNALIKEFLEFYPQFDVEVRDRLASGKPRSVEVALKALTAQYHAFLEANYAAALEESQEHVSRQAAAKGCNSAGAKVCVIAFAGALVNAGIYANVAVATMAVLAVAVIATLGVVTWYLEEDKTGAMGTRLERENMVAELAKVLHAELRVVR
jgi:SdpC family antimicrobial peptide